MILTSDDGSTRSAVMFHIGGTQARRDVDNDGKFNDIIRYDLHYSIDEKIFLQEISIYRESETSTGSTTKVFWKENAWIDSRDFLEVLELAEVDTLIEWLQTYFAEEHNYGATFRREKLDPKEIHWEDFLDSFIKDKGISRERMEAMMLEGEFQSSLTYFGSWREDIRCIVYVPALKEFVVYRSGF